MTSMCSPHADMAPAWTSLQRSARKKATLRELGTEDHQQMCNKSKAVARYAETHPLA